MPMVRQNLVLNQSSHFDAHNYNLLLLFKYKQITNLKQKTYSSVKPDGIGFGNVPLKRLSCAELNNTKQKFTTHFLTQKTKHTNRSNWKEILAIDLPID
jgi:hypothetical protein